ncbi:MAG: hypothetical protein DCF15_19040 [Phormidesmis priestleyi]|uniref:AAA family ATPase n=1 Tax=Phormidesmis priestleyi TaxID=268141 RepID=A0A2W4WSC2_9CYAN|nr:MAG: hypothetical protein DCF15_19040 [Phormidesmis priestleyi]
MLNWISRAVAGKPLTHTLYIVRGISGSGKSSLGRSLTRYSVAADEYPGLYVDGEYQLTKQTESHRWCEAQVKQWMSQKKCAIAVCNTAVKRKYYQAYIELALSHGYTVQIIACEAVIQASGMTAKNIHGVPDSILERQQQNWENHQSETEAG